MEGVKPPSPGQRAAVTRMFCCALEEEKNGKLQWQRLHGWIAGSKFTRRIIQKKKEAAQEQELQFRRFMDRVEQRVIALERSSKRDEET